MDDPRQQHGDHTWDIVIEYVRCPKCGCIMENRQKYEYRSKLYQKDVICDRCRHAFILSRKIRPDLSAIIQGELIE
jgi:hypothetical protein